MTTQEPIRISVAVEREADPVLYDWLSRFGGKARAEQLRSLAHDGALMRTKWLTGPEQCGLPATADERAEQLACRLAAMDMFADPIEDE